MQPTIVPFGKADNLLELCDQLPDCRLKRGVRHSYSAIVAISLAGVLSGCKSYIEIGEWSERLSTKQLRSLGVKRKKWWYLNPSESTLRRTLQKTDPELLDQIIGSWMRENLGGKPGAIACDGKWLNGSGHSRPTTKLLSAMTHDSGVVVGQVEVPDGTNEITVIQPLLREMDLEGVVVTADALHTQRDLIKFLVESKKAHFVLIAKGNQVLVESAIRRLKDGDWTNTSVQIGKGHGRIEKRTTSVTPYLNTYLRKIENFPYVKQVFKVEREVTDVKSGKVTRECVVGVTSLSPAKANASAIGALARGHWAIENRLHWSRDVTFQEDLSQVSAGSGARVMASLRNTAISLLRLRGETKLAPALRRNGTNPDLAIALICGN